MGSKKKIARTEGAKAKISIAKGGGTIFVYDPIGSLVNIFCSTRKAAEIFNCTHPTIAKSNQDWGGV